jgi:hypothetical protein
MVAGIAERVRGAWDRRPPSMRSRPRPQAARRKASAAGPAAEGAPAADLRELRTQRDRLVERFTVMEADLGGAFYEMAIRDHVRIDVLTRKAAELQRVDAELATVEAALELERSGAAGICPGCSAPFGSGTRFCAQCGTPLTSAVAAA